MDRQPLVDDLFKQIQTARRRLLLEQFLQVLPWSLTAVLSLALLGVLVPKLFVLSADAQVWSYWWLGGAVALGFSLALLVTWRKATSSLSAAVELDRRFQLKERISSVLSLSNAERESEAGRALVEDALRRAAAIDVKSQFGVKLSRRTWLPLLPAALAIALAFWLPDKQSSSTAVASSTALETKKQIDESTEELRRKMAERRREAQEKGLNEAAGLFERVERGTEEMKQKGTADREQALVKLNDLAKELQQRRESLGGSENVQKQLQKMNNLQPGPADKLVESVRNGDLKAAQEELKKLQDKLQDDKLDQADKDKLAQQMQQMQQKLQQAADAHAQAAKELQQQMQQAQAQGDQAKQQQLQQQMDQLAQQAPRMDQLQQMAQQLSQAAQGMKDGDPQQASQALDQLTQQLEQLQKENDELESLDQALDQIADAKNAMNCKKCSGGGCEHCQGQGQQGQGEQGAGQQAGGQQPGDGKQGGNNQPGQQAGNGGLKPGVGRGPGLGPENEATGSFFDTRVRQQVGEGKAVITDRIDGPNVKGQVQQEVKAGISSASREESDPLEGVRLPRAQRDHAREYFDSFRADKPTQP